MQKKRHTIEAWMHTSLILALAGGTLLPVLGHAWVSGGAGDKAASAAALADIKISYKLDARVTRGLYMGDRWVSPPTYSSAVDGKTITVDARVEGVDAKGTTIAIRPHWIPADPEMVTVSPAEGSEVKITIQRAGESRVRVTSQGVSKDLAIKAAYKGDAIQVEIGQLRTDSPGDVVAKEAPAVQSEPDTPALTSEMDKLSYALGVNVGSGIRKQAVEVAPDLLIRGFKDALSGGKTLLTEDQVRAILTTLQQQLKTRQATLQAEQRNELAAKNMKEGEAFLARNKADGGVVTLESGLQYKILKAGDGKRPAAEDTVVCSYRGTLIDGTEFDSSYKRGKPASFAVNKLIKGWAEALQLMPAGSKWQLFIPSHLAYGGSGARGKIGPNATLVFEVELISVQGSPEHRAARSR